MYRHWCQSKVKDAVDKAKQDLPNDPPNAPTVVEIEVSNIPIMSVHISGDYDLDRLKKYSDLLKDKVEGFKEVTRADVVGALSREIQVNVDLYKMTAANITMRDIESSIAMEKYDHLGWTDRWGNVKTGDYGRWWISRSKAIRRYRHQRQYRSHRLS